MAKSNVPATRFKYDLGSILDLARLLGPLEIMITTTPRLDGCQRGKLMGIDLHIVHGPDPDKLQSNGTAKYTFKNVKQQTEKTV